MIRNYQNYKVYIEDKPFKTEEGYTYEKTVQISFFDEHKQLLKKIEKGYIKAEDVYKRIDQQKDIILNHCYIHNFSLSEYRKSRNKEPNQSIKLCNFSAYSAIFDSSDKIDFSYAEFDDLYKNFENSSFINGDVIFQGADFNKGGINLSYCFFNTKLFDFSYVNIKEGELNLKNSYFTKGEKNFQNTVFGKGKVLFQNAEFNDGDVSFIDTRFDDGKVSFKVTQFGTGKVDFHFAKFGTSDVSFERTDFGDGKVDFRTTEFKDSKVNFNRAHFGSGAKSFEACQLINGKLTFKRTNWDDGDISFQLAEFYGTTVIFDNSSFGKGELSFYNAEVKELSLKSCHLDYYVDLRLNKAKYIDLSDTIIRDILDLKPHDFRVQIETINFSGARLIGRIFIDWRENKVKNLITGQSNTSVRDKSEQFRILKENFYITGQYSDEDAAYVQFKRHEMKADLKQNMQNNKWNALWAYPTHALKWLIFDRVGLYATDPVRVLISMFFSYLFFALLYFILPLIANTKIISSMGDTGLSSLKVAFYHSAITFLTIGYGDYYPEGIIRWFCGIEGFVGLFLMSYFTVAFVRKILR
jgi:hypothetical protein